MGSRINKMNEIEQKAQRLIQRQIEPFFGQEICKQISMGLVKSSKNWAIGKIRDESIPENLKNICKSGKNSVWTSYVNSLPIRFDENFKKIETPLLKRQKAFISLQKHKTGGEKIKIEKSRGLITVARIKRFIENIKNDVKNIEEQVLIYNSKMNRYQFMFMRRYKYKPVIFIGVCEKEIIENNIPIKKKLLYRILASRYEQIMKKYINAKELLLERKRELFKKIIRIERQNYKAKNKKIDPFSRSFNNPKYEEIERKCISALTEKNLSEMMIAKPTPFKNVKIENLDITPNWKNPLFKRLFLGRVRDIIQTFKYNDKTNIVSKLKSKEVLLSKLHEMDNLWEHEVVEEDQSIYTKVIQDGMFKCTNCKSWKTTYVEKQTRSADEPMTLFITCHECGNVMKR